MYESITRAAGGLNGQEMDGTGMNRIATAIGRPLWRRNTVYGRVAAHENAVSAENSETAACLD